MIPIRLSIKGFLSYREPVEVDFTTFDLACIAGSNGAGKSSLLDAITWSLFGQARKRDDSLINAQSTTAEVAFVFEYESNIYRVLRIKTKEKSTVLEFQIKTPGNGSWKPLTEHTLRETEERIQQILRMDFETFTNASFFLQGKADQFTQQRPGDRKRILSSILGLEIWEEYRQRASDQRRQVETEITSLDGQMREIALELSEEGVRKNRLKELDADLNRLKSERANQESVFQSIQQVITTLTEQQKMVETLKRQFQASNRQFEEMQTRLKMRSGERDSFTSLISESEKIEAAYVAWQKKKVELESMEKVAERFREQEKLREVPRAEIKAANARLEQEAALLLEQQKVAEAARLEITQFEDQIRGAQDEIRQDEVRLEKRVNLDLELQQARQRREEIRAENPRLRMDMEELKTRIDQLEVTEGAECPLCGQSLEAEDRLSLIERLNAQGKELGDRFRSNSASLQEAETRVKELETQVVELSTVENDRLKHTQNLEQLRGQKDARSNAVTVWDSNAAPRLSEIQDQLQKETYAQEARTRLAEVDAELKKIGYDASTHDILRKEELTGRTSDGEMRALEQARAALVPLEREIEGLQKDFSALHLEVEKQEKELKETEEALSTAQAKAPDLGQAESLLRSLKEQENRLILELGAARQKVDVLEGLKARQKSIEGHREELAMLVGQYKQLERAFSKDGVPALLIEQALPEIEGKANEILERLTNGNMSIRFVTQASYKDKNREDLRETLDIQISDNNGTRDYEMFSGGEAFRVNFAVRLALSEVLAQRAGARLQTLVIDEGFGSQDTQGRQRLVEAINQVRKDFSKILVITHIEELKDSFPTRIEVEKTDRGSRIQVFDFN